MIDAAEDMPSKISTGYSTPKIVIAVAIALGLHGALVGVTMLSSSGKAPEAATTSGTGSTRPSAGDPNVKSVTVTTDNKDKKSVEDLAAPEQKNSASDSTKDNDKSQDRDELKLDMK